VDDAALPNETEALMMAADSLSFSGGTDVFALLC
jgi:hypothetical protein